MTSTTERRHPDDVTGAAQDVARLMAGRRTLAVTGAGMSTDSGLPDYRGQGTTTVPPVDFDMFSTDPVWYRWLWYRNEVTWRSLEGLSPNPGHWALASLEAAGLLSGVATQNVDRLDARAGTSALWELHGSYDRVVCLGCGATQARSRLSQRLRTLNPGLEEDLDPAHVEITPEADEVRAAACSFNAAWCEDCGGRLKPGIVMFGESLPQEEMESALRAAQHCDVVLVAGTTLLVSTGLLVVRTARAHGAQLVVVNRGATQVDDEAAVRVEGGCSQVLSAVADCLVTGRTGGRGRELQNSSAKVPTSRGV